MTNSFTLRPRKREAALRVCGMIDLCAAVFLSLAGLALTVVGTWQGPVILVGSLLGLWTGTLMTWGRVYATPERLLVTANRPHRAMRNDIAAIDVGRSDFGKIKQVMPLVKRKNGSSFKLQPLSVASGQWNDPQFADQRRELLARQQEMVEELRSMLGVGGSNYNGE